MGLMRPSCSPRAVAGVAADLPVVAVGRVAVAALAAAAQAAVRAPAQPEALVPAAQDRPDRRPVARAVRAEAQPSISSARNTLTQAQTALARGDFRQAQSRAEGLLQARIPRDVRAAALLVAGDAAYAMRSYRHALVRYSEFLSLPRAALQSGWAQLREGRRDGARLSWMQTARRGPEPRRGR
jgi:hypothetical protein